MKLDDIIKSQKHGLEVNLKRSIYDMVAFFSLDEIAAVVDGVISDLSDDEVAEDILDSD